MAKVIGIDLGTSNSAAAVMMGGKPTIIPAAEGQTAAGKAFPSVVAFSKEKSLVRSYSSSTEFILFRSSSKNILFRPSKCP